MMNTTKQPAAPTLEPRLNPLVMASDGDLLDAWARDGCHEALSTLINRYSVLVLSVCRRCCRNQADADDAFQSTFLILVRSAGKIRNPEQLPGWLHRVAQRAAVATLNLGCATSQPATDVPGAAVDPFDRLTQRHTAIVLDEELANLPEHYRTAIVRHILQGESYLVLAEKSGTSVGTVRGRVQRGKQLLARRLRRRGIVPIIAFSAAAHGNVSQAEAGQIATALTSGAAFPDGSFAPLETTLLQSLLTQGSSTMAKSLFASAGLLGFGLVAFFLYDLSRPSQTSRAEGLILAQFDQGFGPGAELAQPFSSPGGARSNGGAVEDRPSQPPAVTRPPQPSQRPPAAQPPSQHAAAILNALERDVQLPSSAPLETLPQLIQELAAIPVIVDGRGVEFADVSPAASLDFPQGQWPLRLSLLQALRPLGLRAVVDDEGILRITADPSVLVHRGIGLSRWINVDEEAERAIAAKLATKVSFNFVEETLENALRILAQEHEIPILLDRKALEDTPYTPDTPLNLTLSDVTLRGGLELLLRDLELTFTMRAATLVITTAEHAEMNPLTRIYWLEGTGLTGGSGQSMIATIQSAVDPDSWQEAGGGSTLKILSRGQDNRPAIIVSAPYTAHHQLESLLAATREAHFGLDLPFDPVADPLPTPPGGLMGGGMGGMGGMGMGMGGMGMGGGFMH